MNEPNKRMKKPWPTKAAMEQVYQRKLWGGSEFDFYSGEGSHIAEIVDPYIAVVTDFLKSFQDPISVCDLGCGDFNVGRQLVKHTCRYDAVDVVSDLIERNKRVHQSNNLKFTCLDIAVDVLPAADCAILRQVLQHLSNIEVEQILPKLNAFEFVIITEHIPDGDFIPNSDIISGQGTRLKKRSGIALKAPPFGYHANEERLLLSIPDINGNGVIETRLYRN